jgi:hydrogenase/urease accessory protein HupE
MTRILRRALLALVAAAVAWPALAHEMTMAEMEMREVAHGDFIWQWTATNRSLGEAPTPTWPEGCQAADNLLRCGERGLRGTLAMEGVGKRYSAAIVKVAWMDGGTRVYTLTGAQPSVTLHGAADDPRGIGEIAWAYGVLGVEHILAGFDHLLFVIGLLFLVGFNRRLVATITAFTLAHSLTLASSALGWLTLRPPPVEATIAISIVLVAAEALHRRPTLSRTWPALVAFLFGLVHGLGFAGALEQIGLPQNHLLVALLTFNVGVELGQLLVVALAFVLCRVLARRGAFTRARTAALYGIGSIAAFWSIGRIAAILT